MSGPSGGPSEERAVEPEVEVEPQVEVEVESVPDAAAVTDLTDLARALMPFVAVLDLTDITGTPEEVTATATWAPDRCTVGSSLHGGYLMAIADTVGAACAMLNLPDGAGTSTIESKTNFFRSVTSGDVRIVARRVHAGRRTVAVQTDVFRDDTKLVSRTMQTQIVLTG